MTQTENSPTACGTLSRPARFAWLVLILAALYVCYFHNLGAIGFVGPDEPRYAWIARAMVETGDWVTPRLYGKPWFEKPVLYYWGAALSFKLFGVSEAAARLPSAVAALLATLTLAWFALRLYGAETARWLLLLLPTTVGMIGFSHAAATDMPFAGMLTIAMVCAAIVLGLVRDANTPILPRTPWLALLLFGFFLGLAVLAKGPAAIVLCGGAVLVWAILTKRWRDAFRCLHPIAIASFCATALPWYILCARRNPDFFRIFIIEHNFKRYLTPEFQHIQPVWFYIPILLLAVFPWAVLLIPTTKCIWNAYKTQAPEFTQLLFFCCWAGFTFLFFTASKSKLPGYILPAVPPIAALVTRALVSVKRKSSQLLLSLVFGACLAALGIAALFSGPTYKLAGGSCFPPWPDARLIALVGVAGAITVAAVGMFRFRAALLALLICVLALVVLGDQWLGRFDRGLTARATLSEAATLYPGFNTSETATWNLTRSQIYQLNFYGHLEFPEWNPDGPKPFYLLVPPTARAQSIALGFSCPTYKTCPAVITCRNATSSAQPLP